MGKTRAVDSVVGNFLSAHCTEADQKQHEAKCKEHEQWFQDKRLNDVQEGMKVDVRDTE